MSTELGSALGRLYEAFASYKLRGHIESCPCCCGPEVTRPLQAKSLPNLTSADLGLYAVRAMTTIGDVDDFRHFLPRILELAVRDELPARTEIVLGKLAYANWRSWPQAERVAVEGFLREAWRQVRRRGLEAGGTGVESWLCGIACTGTDLGPYLDDWANDQTLEARANLVQFAKDYAAELYGGQEPGAFWEEKSAREQWHLVSTWIQSQLH